MGGFFAISLGGNLKDTRKAFDRAILALHSNRNICVTGASRTVRTDAWEILSPAFLNKVVRGYSRIGVPGLWNLLVRTERQEIRRGKGKLYPRTLDLDFLDFIGPAPVGKDPVLPHPRLGVRPVLRGLLEEAYRGRVVACGGAGPASRRGEGRTKSDSHGQGS